MPLSDEDMRIIDTLLDKVSETLDKSGDLLIDGSTFKEAAAELKEMVPYIEALVIVLERQDD